MAGVTIYTGTARSSRVTRINELFVANPTSTRLIVPTQRNARQRSNQIAACLPTHGFLGMPVGTFQEFASEILEGTPDDLPLVSRTSQHLLLRDAIDRAAADGLLDFLGEAAQSPGFLHHIQHVIAELKQSAIEPDAFRERVLRRQRPSAFDRVVVEIYGHYQNALLATQRLDLQGVYWLADLACRYAAPAVMGSVSTLVIDGFDDFTPSEFRLIQSLADHVDHLVFGLNYDSDPERRDAYAVLRSTHEEIRAAFDCVDIDCEADCADAGSVCDAVASSLFWRTSTSLNKNQPGLREDLWLMPCHTLSDEVESVARAIKRDIVEGGIAVADILVVCKSPETYAGVLTEVFDESGIPLNPVSSPTLSVSPYASTLLSIYDATTQWEREAVLRVFMSRAYQSLSDTDPELMAAYRHASLRAEVIEGLGQWKSNLYRLSERLLARNERVVDTWLTHVPHLQDTCKALLGEVDSLETMSAHIPSEGTMFDHVEAFAALHEAFSIEEVLSNIDAGDQKMTYDTWRAVQTLIQTMRSAPNYAERRVSREDFTRQVRELMSLTELPKASVVDCVQCLSLENARHLQAPYVYCLGLNEGALPSPPPVSAIFSDTDYRDFAQAGFRLDTTREHGNKERLLFLRLFSVATQRLTLSWYETTQQGQSIYPSPFVEDVRDIAKRCALAVVDYAGEDTWPMNRREAVNASVDSGTPLNETLSGEVNRVALQVSLERGRYSEKPFDAYDGALNDAALIEALAGYFDAKHRFSANQIETYLDCPFRYLMNKLLDLPRVETPVRGFSVITIGTIYHDALERFYTTYRGVALENVNRDEVLDTMEHLAVEEFNRRAAGFRDAFPGIARVECHRIVEKLKKHVILHHEAGAGGWLPQHFEVTFGEALKSQHDPLSIPKEFTLPLGEERYAFTGRIDHIELNEDGSQAMIVDFKSSVGSIAQKDIVAGSDIQLTLYAMVLESLLLPGSECVETRYLEIGTHKKCGTVASKKTETRANALARIGDSIHGIQRGAFHPTQNEKSCKYCPSNKVCRYEEGRMAGKPLA